MLIGNVKSRQDLEAKKNLQKELLAVEVANEELKQKKRAEFRSPNYEPAKLLPQYRTPAEIEADRELQEKDARRTLEEIGFDYQKSSELINWLSSSLVNRLSTFNSQAKAIKKEIKDNYDPKIVTVDFVKNYLQKFFDEVDVNYGRKLSGKESSISGMISFEQLRKFLPTEQQLNQFQNLLSDTSVIQLDIKNQLKENPQNFGRKSVGDILLQSDLLEGVIDLEGVGDFKKYIKSVSNSISKLIVLFNEYKTFIPTNSLYNKLEILLNQQERSEFAKLYSSLARRLGQLSRTEFDEIISQFKNAIDKTQDQPYSFEGVIKRLADKTNRVLSRIVSNPELNFNKTVREYIKSKDIEFHPKYDETNIEKEFEEAENRKQVVDEAIEEFVLEEKMLEKSDKPREQNESIETYLNSLNQQEKIIADRTREFLDEIIIPIEQQTFDEETRVKKIIEALVKVIKERPFNPDFRPARKPSRRKNESDESYGIRTTNYIANLVKYIIKEQIKFVVAQEAEGKQYNYDKYRYRKTKNAPETTLGLGLSDKLKQHFKKDEKELRKIKKQLEEESESSSDDELGKSEMALKKHVEAEKSIGLGFRAKRIPVKKIGKGVSAPDREENPTYRAFGKYVIHIPHLLNNDTANFKYPSLGGIPSIKPTKISQDYKDFLIDILNTGKMNEKELKRLPQSEIKHFERVALGAGLVEKFGLKTGNTDEDKEDAKRFDVLRGEYLAGNNNEKLIKELRLLIIKFLNNGRIHKSEATNLLIELATV